MIDRVGPVGGAQAALGEADLGATGGRGGAGDADLVPTLAAPLEDPQDVGRLADLEPGQGHQERQLAPEPGVFLRRWRVGHDHLGGAVHAVALAVPGPLEREGPVVVERGLPEHGPVGHHALAVVVDLAGVAARRPARDMRHPEVAGVDEHGELGRLVVEQRIRPDRVARASPGFGVSGLDVGELLDPGVGVAAVAVGAAQLDRRLVVGVDRPLVAVEAADALAADLGVGLARQVDADEARRDRVGVRRRGGGPLRGGLVLILGRGRSPGPRSGRWRSRRRRAGGEGGDQPGGRG